MWKKIYNDFLDLLFPIECLGCGQEGAWCCINCAENIRYLSSQICPVCYRSNQTGYPCLSCRHESYLDGLFVACDFEQKIIRDMIHALKYKYVEDIAAILGSCIVSASLRHTTHFINSESVILPMPLSRKKYLARGFNQSEGIATYISNFYRAPMALDILYRKNTKLTQAQLNRFERMKNISGAFYVGKRLSVFHKLLLGIEDPEFDVSRVQEKTFVLIDDVYTTGATMIEAARVLKEAGAKEVYGMAVARGRFERS